MWFGGQFYSPTFTFGYGSKLITVSNPNTAGSQAQGWIGLYNAQNLNVTSLLQIGSWDGSEHVQAIDVDGRDTVPVMEIVTSLGISSSSNGGPDPNRPESLPTAYLILNPRPPIARTIQRKKATQAVSGEKTIERASNSKTAAGKQLLLAFLAGVELLHHVVGPLHLGLGELPQVNLIGAVAHAVDAHVLEGGRLAWFFYPTIPSVQTHLELAGKFVQLRETVTAVELHGAVDDVLNGARHKDLDLSACKGIGAM